MCIRDSCYAVPLIVNENEKGTEDIALDKEYHRKMFEMNQKVYGKEVIVGWFITSAELTNDASLIHEYYSSKDSLFQPQISMPSPIVLTIDPKMEGGSFKMKAYTSVPLSVCKDQYSVFQNIGLQMEFFGESKQELMPIIGFDERNTATSTLTNVNVDSVEQQLEEIIENLKVLEDYVKNVNEKKAKGDAKVAKAIKRLLSLSPNVTGEEFNTIINKYTQDVLLLMYLTNIANTQVVISEKLNKILQTLSTNIKTLRFAFKSKLYLHDSCIFVKACY
eukprot:TRINITY_DN1972_c0_g1_i7.p1 TRINITY_DN1972_c0_g1~~TRINITY_DN1972_c0_g1_i7.p1  ORF type:complete len:301 (+),score=109.71 TRINITY_DN1972_c0_g1_i7:73-903(+)